jgi:hypothetical protein
MCAGFFPPNASLFGGSDAHGQSITYSASSVSAIHSCHTLGQHRRHGSIYRLWCTSWCNGVQRDRCNGTRCNGTHTSGRCNGRGGATGHTLCHCAVLVQRDTHFVIDNDRSQGVGFAHSQTKELTDDPTQEGFDLTRGYPVLPHYLALRTPGLSLRSRPLFRSKLRTPTTMGRRSDSTTLVPVCNRCLCLCRHEDIS